MTGKAGLVLLVSASWAASLALAATSTPGSDQFACPQDAPPLCGVARSSLAEAESAVATASARRALWSTAADALRDAQAAFVRGDYQATQRAARATIEQAHMGIAQTAYPKFPFPSY
jgi:hypothetical protein